jgi:hypothetical protein
MNSKRMEQFHNTHTINCVFQLDVISLKRRDPLIEVPETFMTFRGPLSWCRWRSLAILGLPPSGSYEEIRDISAFCNTFIPDSESNSMISLRCFLSTSRLSISRFRMLPCWVVGSRITAMSCWPCGRACWKVVDSSSESSSITLSQGNTTILVYCSPG